MNPPNPSGPSLRNPLAETLKAGRLGLAMMVKQVHSVDAAGRLGRSHVVGRAATLGHVAAVAAGVKND